MKTVLLYILCLGVSAGLLAQPLTVDLGGDIPVCAGDTTYITANATGGTAPYSYNWIPNATLTCDTCQTVGAYPLVSTGLIVTVTDDMGATATDTIQITVITRDTLVMGGNVIEGGWVDSTNAEFLIVEYDISDTFPDGATWFIAAGGDTLYLEDVTSYRDTFSVLDPDFAFFCSSNPDTGCNVNVHITIEPIDNCLTYDLDTNLTFQGFVGINRPLESEALSVYPNPTNYRINVVADAGIESLALYNTLGKAVMLENSDTYSTHSIMDVSQLQQGMYFLHVTTASGTTMIQRVFRE